MDDFIGSSFETPSSRNNNYFLSESYIENDPWSASDFVPSGQPTTTQDNPIDNELVTNGLTAANVLIGVDLPEIFDTAYIRAGPVGDRVSMEALEQVIALAGLGHRLYDQISALIVPPGAMYVTRNEFCTAMALVGCAQKNMELSLVNVYEHRKDLPIPSLPNLDMLQIKRVNPILVSNQNTHNNGTQYVEEDPWRISSTPPSSSPIGMIQSTTSDLFPIYPANNIIAPPPPPTLLEQQQRKKSLPQPSFAMLNESNNKTEWFTNIDQITVSLSERTGFLMFGHVNYLVESSDRQSSVLRRYNDFFWFWDCLMKKYPYRLIPTFPPKKITGKDEIFLENRCQHLNKFLNCVVRHPILRKDELLKVFLTEQQELAHWRRSNSFTLTEEFNTMEMSLSELESFIPSDLEPVVNHVKTRLPNIVLKYHQLIQSMSRNLALKQARAQELKRYNETLRELGEMEQDCYIKDCHACGHVVRGYTSVGQSLQRASTLIETQVSGTTVLDNLEIHKDICISFLTMLDRRTKMGVPNLDVLVKKVGENKVKQHQYQQVEEQEDNGLNKTEHVQYKKDCYLLYCLASELSYLHKQQAFVTRLYQTYVHEQLHYARQAVDNWRNLEIVLNNMPLPEHFI